MISHIHAGWDITRLWMHPGGEPSLRVVFAQLTTRFNARSNYIEVGNQLARHNNLYNLYTLKRVVSCAAAFSRRFSPQRVNRQTARNPRCLRFSSQAGERGAAPIFS